MCNKQDGTFEAVYFYECYKYPDHYIRWYCDGSRVDCEVTICNLCSETMLLTVVVSFLAKNQYLTYQIFSMAEESSQ